MSDADKFHEWATNAAIEIANKQALFQLSVIDITRIIEKHAEPALKAAASPYAPPSITPETLWPFR